MFCRHLKLSLFLVLLALPGCTQVQNLGASFVPKGSADIAPGEIKSGTYQLDPEHASVMVSFNHMNFSRTRARFDSVSATLEYDSANPAAARLSVTIDPASINTNVAEFDSLLKSDEFFDVETYPEATFVSENVNFTGAGTAEVPGALTLHGVSAPVTLQVALTGAGNNWISGKYTLGFSAAATVDRTVFGLDNLLALTGPEVYLEIDAEFRREE